MNSLAPFEILYPEENRCSMDNDWIYALMDGSHIYMIDDPERVKKLNTIVERLTKRGLTHDQITPYLLKQVNPALDEINIWQRRHQYEQ